MPSQIPILLVDDHHLVRKGFRALLEEIEGLKVVGEASNGKEATMLMRNEVKPAIVLLDYEMPVMNGLEAAEVINREFFGVKVIMLTMLEQKSLIEAAVEVGVKGFLFKNTSLEDLGEAIMSVAKGGTWFGSDVALTLLRREYNPETEALAMLSDREIQILKLVAQGYTSMEISRKLFISPRTVDTHRNNIIQKLDLHGIPALVQFAMRTKLI